MTLLCVGDVHGEFDRMVEIQKELTPDFCFQVGDLEPVRHKDDLAELTGPAQYNEIRDYPDYVNGDQSIPVETWFIGGNHEPWSYLYEHDPGQGHDPKLVENLNYLGRGGVKEFDSFTLAYLTGVFGESSYDESSDERLRWAKGKDWFKNKRLGHFREDEINGLLAECEGRSVDILMTHDWPTVQHFKSYPDGMMGYGCDPLAEIAPLIEPDVHVAGHMHRLWIEEYTTAPTTFIGLGKLTSGYPGEWVLFDDDLSILEQHQKTGERG